MTSLDEALRALEKKWRDAVEADRKQPMRMLENVYLCKGMESCADELAALLSSRQEVAPVACRWKTSKAGTHWTYENGTGALALRANGWIVEELYTSTGQTSDARDGDVICIGSDSVVSHTHPEYGNGLFFTEDAIIDAAQLSTNVDELVTAGRLYQEAMDGTHSLQQRVFAAKRFDKALAAMRQEATR